MKYILRKPLKRTTIGLCVILLLASTYFSPKISQVAGNLLFGENKKLYNVNLANFFFKRAAYPLFGNTPPNAHYQLSRTYFIQGNFPLAFVEAEKEVAIYPQNKRAYYMLGLILGYANQEQEAINSFSKFIEWKPDSWAARNDKAWLQFRIGDIDGALLTITPVAQDINNPWVQNTYGTLLMNKKRYPEAQAAFESAKKTAAQMSEELWGMAYPGNDPRIYATGLSAMRLSIQNNLKLLEERSTGGK